VAVKVTNFPTSGDLKKEILNMISNIQIDRKSGVGWTITWANVSMDPSEIDVRRYLTVYEEGEWLNQSLLLFDSAYEANAYILANAPAPAPEGLAWTVAEFTAYGLLATLLDNPNIVAVVCNPQDEEFNVLPAAELIEGLTKALDKPKDAA
jgi:hypothetical protein